MSFQRSVLLKKTDCIIKGFRQSTFTVFKEYLLSKKNIMLLLYFALCNQIVSSCMVPMDIPVN